MPVAGPGTDAWIPAVRPCSSLPTCATATPPPAWPAAFTTTAWRYIHKAVNLLAEQAPTLTAAMRCIAHLAYAIFDGTLIPIDRLSGPQDRQHYAGKPRRHGINT